MGEGRDLAKGASPAHDQVMENFRDQLLIVLMKRLADENGRVAISVAEADDTGQDLLAFSVVEGVFQFQLSKKQ